MFAHASKKTLASRTCPGVSFTVRQVSYGRRSAVASQLQQARPEAAGEIAERMAILRVMFEAMLVDVAGLEVDGRPFSGRFQAPDRAAALDEFLDTAPEPLVEEISAVLLNELHLGEDAEKNSASPSGSPCAATEGDTTAASASGNSSGPRETAAATTPAR